MILVADSDRISEKVFHPFFLGASHRCKRFLKITLPSSQNVSYTVISRLVYIDGKSKTAWRGSAYSPVSGTAEFGFVGGVPQNGQISELDCQSGSAKNDRFRFF
jgi:hypothetical protein